jgi:hypothetical protein
MVEVQVERAAVADARLETRHCPALVLDVDVPSALQRERLVVELPDAGASRSFVHVRPQIAVRPVPGVLVPPALVVRARRAVPLLESVIGRPPPVLRPEMPLPEARGRVPRFREDVGDRPLPRDQSLAAGVSRDGMRPGPDRVAPCQQGRA